MESQVFENEITKIFQKFINLESLEPSAEVDKLFKEFWKVCKDNTNVDVTKLSEEFQEMKNKFVKLCANYEATLEKHYANTLIQSFEYPLNNLHIFPFTPAYVMRMPEEYNLIMSNLNSPPKKVAFLGSGPLPLTTIFLARDHLKMTIFDNFDLDQSANEIAAKLVAPHQDLAQRMNFYTKDVMDLTIDELSQYKVVLLASLVGLDNPEKARVISHLSKNMAIGSILMVRSVHGAKALIYPLVLPEDLHGFKVLSIWHPSPGTRATNSIIIATRDSTNEISKD